MNYKELAEKTLDFIYKARASLQESPVALAIRTLAELRTSQINGCAYCCRLHTDEARKLGISQEKLDLLPVWHHAICFTSEEKIILAWVEAVTKLDQEQESAKKALLAIYSEKQVADLTTCIGIMNALNRIVVNLS